MKIYGRIYLFTHKISGKMYVGRTVNTLKCRLHSHLEEKKKSYISKALNKDGIEAFHFDQIDTGYSKTDLDAKEILWMEKLDTLVPNGYNLVKKSFHKGTSERYFSASDVNFISENIALLTNKQIAKSLGRSEKSIKSKIESLGLKRQTSYGGHKFVSLPDFINGIISKHPEIGRQVITAMFRNGIIKKLPHEKNKTAFLEPKEAEKWQRFFDEYTLPRFLNGKVPKPQNYLKWDCLRNIKISEQRQFAYWLNRSDINNMIETYKNYVSINEFSKLTGYKNQSIHKLIRNKVVNNHVIFLNTRYFHKDEIEKAKQRFQKNVS